MNLVICADGTWNTPDMMDDGVPSPTNVYKFFNCVARTDKDDIKQERYYHQGVGTEGSRLKRMIEGGTGKGLGKNIKSAYRWLAATYRPGDRIFLLGFSRGAYTVRSLGGMVSRCGLADLPWSNNPKHAWDAVDRIYDEYRWKETSAITASADLPFHNAAMGSLPTKTTPIHFIGVWDTVGSLGIPDDFAFLNLLDDVKRHGFHNTEISDIVRHARHAVAIDERRLSFVPTLWKPNPNVDMQQVWFPGVHADVGGGYGRAGLSDGALLWMIEEARGAGLAFEPDAVAQIIPHAQDVLHDSVQGVFKKLKTRPRAVPLFDHAAPTQDVHATAYHRQKVPPLAQGEYWRHRTLPDEVNIYARQQWNATGIYLQAGKTYDLTASGEWMDAAIKCGPGGATDGKFHPAEALYVIGNAAGAVQGLLRKLSGNERSTFPFAPRVPTAPWFALIGVIANDYPPPPPKPQPNQKQKVQALPHEVFVIGTAATVTPKASGYLFCFANDAWERFENNRGTVRLKVVERQSPGGQG
jgi:uncharacterized protein (DUF2235 family)